MTAMQQAFADAELKRKAQMVQVPRDQIPPAPPIPNNPQPAYEGKREFYWHWIKDHPYTTVRQMRIALKGPAHNDNGIRLAVASMVASGALQASTVEDRAIDRKLRVNPRYATYKDAYASGELHPVNARKPRPVAPPTAAPVAEPKAEQPDVAPVRVFDLEDLSIREARQLYEKLKKMFGDSK